jgi:hypothetical protein
VIQEANRWTNVLKTRTAAGLGVAAETSGVVMESATKTFSSWRGRKKTTRGEESGGGAAGGDDGAGAWANPPPQDTRTRACSRMLAFALVRARCAHVRLRFARGVAGGGEDAAAAAMEARKDRLAAMDEPAAEPEPEREPARE